MGSATPTASTRKSFHIYLRLLRCLHDMASCMMWHGHTLELSKVPFTDYCICPISAAKQHARLLSQVLHTYTAAPVCVYAVVWRVKFNSAGTCRTIKRHSGICMFTSCCDTYNVVCIYYIMHASEGRLAHTILSWVRQFNFRTGWFLMSFKYNHNSSTHKSRRGKWLGRVQRPTTNGEAVGGT